MATIRILSPVSPLAVGLAGGLALAVAMGIGRFAFTPLLPLMIRDGQLDLTDAGWLAAANYAGYLVGAVTAARLPWPAGRVSLVALLSTAVLTAAMALPVPMALWLGFRALAGVCSAWAFVATSMWCLTALAALQRPAWGGRLYAGVGAGMALAGLYCAAGAGAQASTLWLQLGLLALAMTVPVATTLRRIAPTPVPARHEASVAPPPKGMAGLVWCYGLFGFGYILPATFLPALARAHVADPRLFGLAWPLFGLTAMISTLLAGRIMHSGSRLKLWAVSHVLMAAGVLLPTMWISAAAIGLSALLVGGTFMVITMAGIQEVRARSSGDAGRLVARMTAAFATGQMAGPISSSLLLRWPGRGGDDLSLALQLAAAVLLASAAWLWLEHRRSFDQSRELSHVH